MRRARGIVACVFVAFGAVQLGGYLKMGSQTSSGTVTRRWRDFPARYFISNSDVDGVNAQQFQAAVSRAFATWHAVPNTETSSQFVGFTQATAGIPPIDEMSVLGFANRPEESRTLAATSFVVNVRDGSIIESDIYFNSAFPWSTSQTGSPGRFDVESIAVHEVGHFLGLSHSALGETELVTGGRRVIAAASVMFPIAFSAGNIADRELQPDDIAGISDIYGTSAFARRSGSISGRVTKNGQPVLGAHIVAFNPATGKSVGGFSLGSDGGFVIGGLDPGPHVLRAEPLDDAEIESFFLSLDVDLDFRVKFHERVVVVPRGGGTRSVEIKVTPK